MTCALQQPPQTSEQLELEHQQRSRSSQVGMSGSAGLGGVGAVEPIPRDYHRRVLKKIAQLTKVTLTADE